MKYLLLCTFSCHEIDDDELFMNNWKVGEFSSVLECYTNSLKDIEQVGRDSLEGRFEEDEQDKFLRHLNVYINSYEITHRDEDEFKLYEPIVIGQNDYWTDYRREILNYIVIKVED